MVMLKTSVRVVEILLIEDNPGDVRLTQECLSKSKVANRLNVVEDGEQAFLFLRKEGKFSNAPRPDLILLDLNIPKKDGRELLVMLKNNENLKRVPVIILTSSDSEADVKNSYNLHANCFITKPIIFEDFIRVINMIEDFWLTVVTLPER